MANILDYIIWRGDLTFKQDPFNEVDSLIFATLSYVDFELTGLAITKEQKVTIKEAGEAFAKLHADEKISAGRIIPDEIFLLFDEMSRTRRYEDLYLSNYINKIDEEKELQFSAVTIELSKHEIYIAYRGTDDTIVGWKEDFNMSFKSPVPAQLEAVDYLQGALKGNNKRVHLGGHSKGGNLAIYAYAFSNESIQKRVLTTHSFDGPGFLAEIFEKESLQQALRKVKTIIPQSSIIGMLLEHEDYKVVVSKNIGIMQHDPFSWEVLANTFVYMDDITSVAYRFDQTLRHFLLSMNLDEKKTFVEMIFLLLEDTNAKTLSDLTIKDMTKIVKKINTKDSVDKELLKQAFKLLLQSVEQQRIDTIGQWKLALPNLQENKKI